MSGHTSLTLLEILAAIRELVDLVERDDPGALRLLLEANLRLQQGLLQAQRSGQLANWKERKLITAALARKLAALQEDLQSRMWVSEGGSDRATDEFLERLATIEGLMVDSRGCRAPGGRKGKWDALLALDTELRRSVPGITDKEICAAYRKRYSRRDKPTVQNLRNARSYRRNKQE